MQSLSELGKIAGIAGICVGALVLIFRTVIRKNFFSTMNDQQSYRTIQSIIWIAGGITVLGIMAYLFSKKQEDVGKMQAVHITGKILDNNNVGLPSLEVILNVNGTEQKYTTDHHGKYLFSLSGTSKTQAKLIVNSGKNTIYSEGFVLEFDEDKLKLDDIIIKPEQLIVPPTPIVDVNPNDHVVPSSSSYIIISSNAYSNLLSSISALASVNLTIGGLTYQLTGSDITVPIQQAGALSYSIFGSTQLLGSTYCQNNTSGYINAVPNGRYYMFENVIAPTDNGCNWFLYEEQEFLRQQAAVGQ
jgi:hypothetical protein